MARWTAAKIELLYLDITRLVMSDPTLTPGKIARDAKLSSAWIVRDIGKPHWHVKNPIQLFRIESTLCRHPGWFPREVWGEDDQEGLKSYIFRRWVDPFSSPDFRNAALLWNVRESDAEFLQRFSVDPWVTVLDTRASRPEDYRVISYASAMKDRYGFDKKGVRLADNICPVYADFVSRDFGVVVSEPDRPHCKDVVYANDEMNYKVVFRNICFALPKANIVLSKLKIELWRAGRFEFNMPREEAERISFD